MNVRQVLNVRQGFTRASWMASNGSEALSEHSVPRPLLNTLNTLYLGLSCSHLRSLNSTFSACRYAATNHFALRLIHVENKRLTTVCA